MNQPIMLPCPRCVLEHSTRIARTCIKITRGSGFYGCEHDAWGFDVEVREDSGALRAVIVREYAPGDSAEP